MLDYANAMVPHRQPRKAQDAIDNWQEHVDLNPDLLRPTDIKISLANPGKAERELGWKARYGMKEVATMMVDDCMEKIAQ